MEFPIRVARAQDAAAVAAIYRPIVTDSAISFEEVPPDPAEVERRILETLTTLPYLVWDDGQVRGYAYAAAHRNRAAYRWSVDVSIYLHPEARRQGIGRRLYEALFDLLAAQNYVRAFAGITLPNEASVGLHRSLGFRQIATYPKVGYKHGQWHDTGWFCRPLRDSDEAPSELIPFPVLRT